MAGKSNPYSRTFHLSWLGFFVAFLSWFAFPPLVPEAIKTDLKLTAAEVANSNIIALVSTLVVRIIVGPLVDRYGPRKVMAGILVLGAVPSGLAGTAHNASTLYVIRFFIGILGASFVPCQAWTSVFFDRNVIGTANALVAGWGNAGGGATFAIMVSLYSSLRSDGLSQHSSWRAAFAIVPVPILLTVAVLTLVFGQDHPAGDWSQRNNIPASTIVESHSSEEKELEKGTQNHVTVHPVPNTFDSRIYSSVDIAVNQPLSWKSGLAILSSPLTWLPAFAYLSTFGLELAIDGQLSNILFTLFNKRLSGFDQTKAGYYTAIFGLLNVFTRPFGGFVGDRLYTSMGTKAKKYWTLLCGFVMGLAFLAAGLYLQKHPTTADLPTLMGLFALAAVFSELGNGANFSLVPHCNSNHNGVMSGLVGSFGNLGGIIFALVFRFQPAAKAFWITGAISIALNLLLLVIPVPKY